MDIRRIFSWLFRLARGTAIYSETVHEQITTTDATPTSWTTAEIPIDTTTAGSITVRYVINGQQSDGSNLYSITSERSYSWAVGGPVTRRSAAGGSGTTNANTFASPRPTHTFDLNNIRPTVTGKAGTTIKWSCVSRALNCG